MRSSPVGVCCGCNFPGRHCRGHEWAWGRVRRLWLRTKACLRRVVLPSRWARGPCLWFTLLAAISLAPRRNGPGYFRSRLGERAYSWPRLARPEFWHEAITLLKNSSYTFLPWWWHWRGNLPGAVEERERGQLSGWSVGKTGDNGPRNNLDRVRPPPEMLRHCNLKN